MEAINGLRKVYDYLSDEESREIFRLKVEYLITGDWHPIETITRKYLPMLQTAPLYSVDEIIRLSGDKHIVFYGAGDDAVFYSDYIREFPKDKIVAFCDRKKELQDKGFLGYKVISPEYLQSEYRDAFIVISSTIFDNEIRDSLLAWRFSADQILSGLFPRLSGEKSQYFDSKIVGFNRDGEVYVDGGSMNLSSVRRLSTLANVKKVYAFEPNRKHYERCELIKEELGLDIDVYPLGLWSRKTELCFESRNDGGSHLSESGKEVIKVCSLEDVVDIQRKITFIKMDVEGAELEALKGCQNIIKRDRPKLAICIYHKPEDMYAIPLFIKSVEPDYRLYVRHYSNRQFETVLYAVI